MTKFGIPDMCSVLTIIPCSDLTNLLPAEQDQAIAHFSKKHEVFATLKFDLGCAEDVSHYIDTGNSPPIRLCPIRRSLATKSVVNKEVVELIKRVMLVPYKLAWASLILIDNKKYDSN